MSFRGSAARTGLGAVMLVTLLAGCSDSLINPPDRASSNAGQKVGSVTITGAPAAPLVQGATAQLGADVRGTNGKPLDRAAAWTSSDSLVARVSATGLVTAVAPGQAAITATSGGVSDTETITVVPPPDPTASIALAASKDLLYVGQLVQVAATAKDSAGNVISVPLTWTSSDPAKAFVDSAGVVVGTGAGAVNITAATRNASASVALTVLERPVAEWSQAGAWGTFQGNAKHTGHVPATADPLSFRALWTAPVAPGVVLNPVASGDGKVFVSTNAYFGKQVLTVLDARTGGQAWTRDFGAIHGIHPPAYGGGRVYVTTSGHQDSFLWSLDASSGAVQFSAPYQNQWSRYFAPVVADGAVYMAGGYYGGMYAFRTVDGGESWFFKTNQYDQWTPAVDDGLVYAYTGDYSPKLSVTSAATGAVAYEIADPSFDWNGWSMNVAPVLGSMGNVLATQANRLISFDLAGRRIGWQHTATFTGSVTVADGVLYVFNAGRVEARAEADGAFLWGWSPPEGKPFGTMIATRNLLFVSTGANTYAVDLAARRHVWSYPAGGHLALDGDGILLIAQANGSVSAVSVR